VHDNVITEIYDTAAIPSGVQLIDASGQVTGNVIRGKAAQALGTGVNVTSATGTGVPLALARNQIYDMPEGVRVSGGDPTTFSSDVIANTGVGLSIFSNPGVTATGLTVTHSTSPVNREIYVDNTALTLDSSIVGDQGVEIAGTGTCTSAFSRGPAVPDNCGFATAADPAFANPAADDLHLLPGSPMVDAGNPAAPVPGESDVDGGPRAVDATPGCPPAPRRDIGADERPGAALLDCDAPDTAVNGKSKVKSRKKRARVAFTLLSEPGAIFECKLDSGAFAPCTSPYTARLRRGAHTLTVRAADASGNVDASPAVTNVKVKKKKRKKK
jgi:hypothetical protein